MIDEDKSKEIDKGFQQWFYFTLTKRTGMEMKGE